MGEPGIEFVAVCKWCWMGAYLIYAEHDLSSYNEAAIPTGAREPIELHVDE